VLEKYDKRNSKKRMKKGCTPFCHSPRSSISKVVSIKKNKQNNLKWTKEEEKVYKRGLLRTKGLLTLHTFLLKRKNNYRL
jgi:hypothetical protein